MALNFSAPAQAADWQFTPSVGASVTYTDNINQAASNPQDGLIFSVSPGFSLNSKGSRRVQASMNYNLSSVARFSDDNTTDLLHNLGAIGKAELIEDFLFVDGTASVSQSQISLFGSSADAATNASNRANTAVYSIAPYVQKRFGTFATAQARYALGGSTFGGNAATSDSVTNAFSASLISGTRFNDLSWALDYSLRKAENDTATDTTFERATLTLGYALTRKFRVFGSVGQDENDFLSSTNSGGSSYSVGIGWAPTQRTSLEASAGERYFGSTFSLSARHRTRMSNWTVRYYEDVSDITQQTLEQTGRIFWVCNGALEETPDNNPPQTACPTTWAGPILAGQLASYYSSHGFTNAALVAANLLDVGIANGVYVIKSLTAGVTWDWKRFGWGLSASDTTRIYQFAAGVEDHAQSVSGTANYRLSPRTTANAGLSLTKNSGTGGLVGGSGRNDDLVSLNLGMNHEFARDLSGALTFRHQQRDSDAVNSDYEENSLGASVSMRF
ncbi:MAG: TIGR03016 family PEP-CTERM system-associated outer membrane protein [Thiobacillus sp.]